MTDGPLAPAHPRSRTEPYRIRFDEAGADGIARASAVLAIAQDAAWRHSEALGFTREWYAERGLVWLVRSIAVHLAAPVAYGETVHVWTAVVGERRVMARRESRVTAADGSMVAAVMTDWVLTDARGAPTRIPDDFTAWLLAGPATFEPLRVDRADPPASASTVRLSVRARDLDPMGHVNNTVYADYFDEAVVAAGGTDAIVAFPRRYALEYVGSATYGDALLAIAWPADGGWNHRLVRAEDGATLLRGTLGTLGTTAPPV